ncbi:MAG TPA: HD domain-containing phosphohydrolase, partial [Synergistales bacterium]|nr:HD domain-containing phosphohydrolase [Synergistales bacterium]
REALWERTLEFSRAFARNQDVDAAISSTLDTLRRDVKAFGVLLSSVEGNSFRLTAWSGYNGELADFVVSKDGIAASESIISRSPVWVEDVRTHPTAHPVHPSVKSELLIPLFQAGEEEGVLEVAFDRPMRRDSFLIETLTPVASFLGGLVHGEKMRRELKASYAYLAEKLQFVTGIYHDETEAHIARIGEYCKLLAREIGRDASEQEDIALFARLHDIGKLRIPYGILVKPGTLDTDEFEQIKRHPQWGAEILGDAAWLQMARNICLTHHEKWDGSGYPRGLHGTEIPWEGRVATIADIYDALRSSRSYKPAMSHELAVSILLEGDERVRPEHFDPKVLTAFRRISGKFEEIFDSNCDERDSPDCFLA